MGIEARIDEIAGGQWWRAAGRAEYVRLAGILTEQGFTEDEAVSFLQRAYTAAAAEFGN